MRCFYSSRWREPVLGPADRSQHILPVSMSRTLSELLEARIASDGGTIHELDQEIATHAAEFPHLYLGKRGDIRVYIDCPPRDLHSHLLGVSSDRESYVSGQGSSYHSYRFGGFEIRLLEDQSYALVVRGVTVPLSELKWTRHQDEDGCFAATTVGELTFRTTESLLIMDHPLTTESLEEKLDSLRSSFGTTHGVIRYILEQMDEMEHGSRHPTSSYQQYVYILSQFSVYFPFVTLRSYCSDPTPVVYLSPKSAKQYYLVPARKIPSSLGSEVTYDFPDYSISFDPDVHDSVKISIGGTPTSLARSTPRLVQLDSHRLISIFGVEIKLYA